MNKYFILLFILFSITSKGQSTFTKEFLSNNFIQSKSIIQNDDSTYIIVGHVDTLVNIHQFRTAFVKKMNKNGDLIWTKYYSFPDAYGLFFNKIIKTSDSNYLIVGSIDFGFSVSPTFIDVFVCKIDTSGNMLWNKNYGDVGTDEGIDAIEHNNGEFSIFSSFGKAVNLFVYNAFQIIRTNSIGDSIWTKQYYNNDTIEQFPSKFDITSDGGYILAGNCTNPNATENALLIKTNNNGDTLWTKKLNTNANSDIVGVVSNIGSFTIYGNMDSSVNIKKPFIANFSNAGTTNWFQYLNVFNTHVFSVSPTLDGANVWHCLNDTTNTIIKTDNLGNILWTKALILNLTYLPSEIIATNDSSYICTGSKDDLFNSAFFLSKLKDSIFSNTAIFSQLQEHAISVFPNPVCNELNFTISESTKEILQNITILTMTGQVHSTYSKSDFMNKKIDISKLESGIYVLSFNTKYNYQIKPIVFVKQ